MQTPDWYLNRLRTMSLGEVAHRMRATLQDGLLRVSSAAPVPPASDNADGIVWARGGAPTRCRQDIDRYGRAADAIVAGRFAVFDIADAALGADPDWNRDPRTHIVAPLTFGKGIDYRDERLVGDIKCLWEINRHLQWVTIAQAYKLSGDLRHLHGLARQLDGWLRQCPYPLGVNWCSALELGIRLLNWSWVWSLVGGRSSALFQDQDGQRRLSRWLTAIYQHLYFIDRSYSAYSSANNHLIGEAAGAFVGCCVWPYWGRTSVWKRKAHEILEREALLQNSPDGVNLEQAFSYQQFVLDFLLSAGLAGEQSGMPFTPAYWDRMEAMVDFLAAVTDTGGNVPAIGDADDGYVYRLSPHPSADNYASLRNTAGLLFARADLRATSDDDDKTAWLLEGASPRRSARSAGTASATRSRAFAHGGYAILSCRDAAGRAIECVADVGPLGYLGIAAHGHADALSLVLSYDGQEVLIDPGTYAYHTQAQWRGYFRGTAAHNTLQVDGRDQSESGGNFMWTRHAGCTLLEWHSDGSRDHLSGRHDGYHRLADPVTHTREFLLDKPSATLTIVDSIECRDEHEFVWHWHFAEDWRTQCVAGAIEARRASRVVRIAPDDASIAMQCKRGSENPPLGWVSRRFGVRTPTDTWAWRRVERGRFVMRITVSFA